VSPQLVKPLVKARIETARIINHLEDVATHKKDPVLRATLRKGRWRFKENDFKNMKTNLELYKKSYKKADKVLPKGFDIGSFPRRADNIVR
jgi:hypothetical protein